MGGIAVVDYGAGNLMSVCNALDFLHCENRVVRSGDEIARADGVILPGVGAFADAMCALAQCGLADALRKAAREKAFLGICLGMQMLFEESSEMEKTAGLGLLKGRVKRIKTDLKLPQIGWNSLDVLQKTPLTADIESGSWAYFVHSYQVVETDEGDVAAVCDYHARIPAIVAHGNLFGCQFHPEKSGETGLAILRSFAALALEGAR